MIEQEHPPQRMLLVFAAPCLETEYLSSQYQRSRSRIRANVIFTATVLLLFALLDPFLIPADLLPTFRAIRLGVLVPMAVSLLIPLALVRQPRQWCRIAAGSVLLFGLAWPALLFASGLEVLGYLTLALNQTIVGTFFLLGLPVALSIPVVTVFTVAFIAVLLAVEMDAANALTYSFGCLAVAVVSGFGAYRAENASRQQFVAEAWSRAQVERRLAAEADRNRWLEVFASFLRHELSNAMAGIKSSIDLAVLESRSERTMEVLERGRLRVQFVGQLLAHAADATSLEAALAMQDTEDVCLSELVADQIDHLALNRPDWTIESRIAEGIHVEGNPDRLVQMLDKLFDNAFDHGDPQHPITVLLDIENDQAVLSIADLGEALPDDVERMFLPFVSDKHGHPSAENLGLGLYVARTIAAGHKGYLTATRLSDPPGASFTVRIPLLQRGIQR